MTSGEVVNRSLLHCVKTLIGKVLAKSGIHKLDEHEVSAIVHGSGTIRGWMPFTIGWTPWNVTVQATIPDQLKGDEQLQRDVKKLVYPHSLKHDLEMARVIILYLR